MLVLKPSSFLAAGFVAGVLLAIVSLVWHFPIGWIGALRLGGTALILGHLVAAIALVGNDLRVGQGNSLATDSWTMVLGYVAIAWLAFTPREWRVFFSDFVIANMLIALLLASYVALLFVQLVAYARDTL